MRGWLGLRSAAETGSLEILELGEEALLNPVVTLDETRELAKRAVLGAQAVMKSERHAEIVGNAIGIEFLNFFGLGGHFMLEKILLRDFIAVDAPTGVSELVDGFLLLAIGRLMTLN